MKLLSVEMACLLGVHNEIQAVWLYVLQQLHNFKKFMATHAAANAPTGKLKGLEFQSLCFSLLRFFSALEEIKSSQLENLKRGCTFL